MATLPLRQRSGSWRRALSAWWSNPFKKHHALVKITELKCFADEEIERMARLLGMSADEIRKLLSRGPDAAQLLFRRMQALELDRDQVFRLEPRVLEELKASCALCGSRRRCLADLARNPYGPAWEDYCPNAGTLLALTALPWVSRRAS